MASSTFCVDGLIELHTNHTCALVFEKLHWLIHRAPDADDFTYTQEGQKWQEFTYAHLFKFFTLEKPDGTPANILGKERTLRRAIEELKESGLIITRRCQRGIALAVNHKTLQKIVGKENLKRYGADCPKVDTQKVEPISECPKVVNQNTVGLSNSGQSELPKVATQPIYKELDSLEDSLKEKDLPDAKASDEKHTFDSLLQLANLPALTTPQKETLITWLMATRNQYPNPVDPQNVDMTKKQIQILGNLVKKGVLSQTEIGISTKLTERKDPKSILMNATYDDLGETPPKNAKSTDKPFWELCAAMVCWNKVNMKWRVYFQKATPQEIKKMNEFIKQCCEALDEIHDEQPIAVDEFKAFIRWWYDEKFKKEDDDEKFFPTSPEKLKANFIPFRTLYRQEHEIHDYES